MERSEVLVFLNRSNTSIITTSSVNENHSMTLSPELIDSRRNSTVSENGNKLSLHNELIAADSDCSGDVMVKDSSSSSPSTPPHNSHNFHSFSSFDDTNQSILGCITAPNSQAGVDMLKSLLEIVLQRLDDLEVTKSELQAELNVTKNKIMNMRTKFKSSYNELHENMEFLTEKCYGMECRLIETEQYSRRESLVISGIPANIDQSKLEVTVLSILKAIGLHDVSSYQVTACHRLANRNKRYPPRTIIRFTNRKIVRYCLENRSNLLKVKGKLTMNHRFWENLSHINEKCL